MRNDFWNIFYIISRKTYILKLIVHHNEFKCVYRNGSDVIILNMFIDFPKLKGEM